MNNIETLHLWAYEMKIDSSVKCHWVTGYNDPDCPHDFHQTSGIIVIHNFEMFFFIVLLFAYKKIRMILPLITHWMVQWKPQAAGALSATKLCWNSNPLCVAFCCNINFINITANTFMGLCKPERKCKCYQTFHPFLYIYFYLFCHKFCADAGVTEEYKAKELSELRSLFYVHVCVQFCVLVWTENILHKYFNLEVNYRNTQ